MRRLSDEYAVQTLLDMLPHTILRLVVSASRDVRLPSSAMPLVDRDGNGALLFTSEREARYAAESVTGLVLRSVSENVRTDQR